MGHVKPYGRRERHMAKDGNRQKFAGIAGGIETPPQDPQGADGAEEADGGDGEDGGKDGGGQQNPAKYTDDDVSAIVQKRLARERQKMEAEIRKSIQDEADAKQTEAQRLENMTELQRAQYEAKKLKAEKEALEAERDLSQQTAIARRELAAVDINLGDDLLAMFVSADADKTGKAIEQIKELFPKAVNEAVQKQLRREPPKADPKPGSKSFGASFAQEYSKSKVKQTENGGK